MNDAFDNGSRLPPIDAATLGAYIDGELTDAQRAAVQAELAHDDETKARADAWRAQKAALQALCGPADNDRAPVIVLRPRLSWPRRFALAAVWLLTAGGAGLLAGAWSSHFAASAAPAAFARRADIAYAVYTPEVRHPVEVGGSDETHLVAWLSKRLDRHLSAPSLQEYGYSLVGGRLLPGDDKSPAAQFMYENREGARLTLYVTRASSDEFAVRSLRAGSRRTLYWVADRTGYALSGAMPEARLRAIAVDVCSALGGKPQTWQ
ncbi:MAG TPA: anti-sigma factor [Trinickia sp.]